MSAIDSPTLPWLSAECELYNPANHAIMDPASALS